MHVCWSNLDCAEILVVLSNKKNVKGLWIILAESIAEMQKKELRNREEPELGAC